MTILRIEWLVAGAMESHWYHFAFANIYIHGIHMCVARKASEPRIGMKVNKRRDLFERKAIDLIFTASTNKFTLPFSTKRCFSSADSLASDIQSWFNEQLLAIGWRLITEDGREVVGHLGEPTAWWNVRWALRIVNTLTITIHEFSTLSHTLLHQLSTANCVTQSPNIPLIKVHCSTLFTWANMSVRFTAITTRLKRAFVYIKSIKLPHRVSVWWRCCFGCEKGRKKGVNSTALSSTIINGKIHYVHNDDV